MPEPLTDPVYRVVAGYTPPWARSEDDVKQAEGYFETLADAEAAVDAENDQPRTRAYLEAVERADVPRKASWGVVE